MCQDCFDHDHVPEQLTTPLSPLGLFLYTLFTRHPKCQMIAGPDVLHKDITNWKPDFLFVTIPTRKHYVACFRCVLPTAPVSHTPVNEGLTMISKASTAEKLAGILQNTYHGRPFAMQIRLCDEKDSIGFRFADKRYVSPELHIGFFHNGNIEKELHHYHQMELERQAYLNRTYDQHNNYEFRCTDELSMPTYYPTATLRIMSIKEQGALLRIPSHHILVKPVQLASIFTSEFRNGSHLPLVEWAEELPTRREIVYQIMDVVGVGKDVAMMIANYVS